MLEKVANRGQIRTFDLPVETSSCAVSSSEGRVYFSTDDGKDVYTFKTAESTAAVAVSVLGKADDDVTGLAVYVGESSDYLLVAQTDVVAVYSTKFGLLGSMKVIGAENAEIQGLSVYQGKSRQYPAGVLTYAVEDEEGKGFGISSLESALKSLKLDINTKYDPRSASKHLKETICEDCYSNGFCTKPSPKYASTCSCFAGFAGKSCKAVTCTDNCSRNGKCVGANECRCDSGWGGLHCSFLLVQPKLETQSNGGDGDDPAIWISPVSPDQSRIITTTKSEQGAGLGVFDLSGELLQTLPAGEPNNVDMIYNFTLGNNRVIDLAYAACREDNTLCLFEMSANGTLSAIPGGIQPVLDDYDVYGSCVYRSPKTGTQYLFVNNKKAEYLQYSLTSTLDGTLSASLVRQFIAGSGGQVEGCVADEENGFLFVGEEPEGLWRYDAEPGNQSPKGVKVASVATYADHKPGDLYADVEGVTIVPGKTASEGFIIVSCQGVSAYNVYECAPPHTFVQTFTITNSRYGNVDHVTNTDGIAAVGNRLNDQFPAGLFVTHDDTNELPNGKTSDQASFKLVSLADVLKGKGLLEQVDKEWNPRL
jgi:3-phytase